MDEYLPEKLRSLPVIPDRCAYVYLPEIEYGIFVIANNERRKAGLEDLVWDEDLRAIARYKAREMLQFEYFAHSSPYTGNSWNLAEMFGYCYTAFGENLAKLVGYSHYDITPEIIMEGWMESPGHRENILRKTFRKAGIGLIYSPDDRIQYSSLLFSR